MRLADNPAVAHDAQISELGARADTVSSFPAVVKISAGSGLKAGMAIEITLEIAVDKDKGFALPLSVLALEGKIKGPNDGNGTGEAFVYAYDEASGTVKRRGCQLPECAKIH